MASTASEGARKRAADHEKPKLTGRKFYESIGSPKVVIAPMVDRSEFVGIESPAWRMLTRSFFDQSASASLLAYSPMFHARLFAEMAKNRDQCFQPTREAYRKAHTIPAGEPFLDGNPELDRPLFVQFCANDPDELLAAARYVEPFCDAVDLNLGCPQGIARKGNYGAFLQEDPSLISRLINKLHKELSIPVTAKMRILETKEATLEYARTILDAGASIISVHGRRREQKGHNTGVADWSYIRYLRDNLPPDTVIFANGNILNHNDLSECLKTTGADAVMSAEGNLSDPTIFSKPPALDQAEPAYWRGKNGEGGFRVDAVLRRYLDIIHQYVLGEKTPVRSPLFMPGKSQDASILTLGDEEDHSPEPPRKRQKRDQNPAVNSPSLKAMQGHLFHMLRALVARHTDIRDTLAKCRLGDIAAFERVLSMVEKAVARGLQEYEVDPDQFSAGGNSKEVTQDTSLASAATKARYHRPFWVCQPYIRPLPEEAYQIGAMSLSKKALAAKELEEQTSKWPSSSQAATASKKEAQAEVSSELPREAVVCG
ncbi:MAG: hypothetical protein Q9227_000564 [Pyrenula ochraceoflavens]